jgi:hypothetical protein
LVLQENPGEPPLASPGGGFLRPEAPARLNAWRLGDSTASDHQQNATHLRQQRQQDQPQHCEVVARWLKRASAHPTDNADCGLSLRIGRQLDRAYGSIERLAPLVYSSSRCRQAGMRAFAVTRPTWRR